MSTLLKRTPPGRTVLIPRRFPTFTMVCTLTAVLGGCVTVSEETSVTSGQPSKPRDPIAPPPLPRGLEPTVMILSSGTPMDSDANGFPDTVPIVVYLFGDPNRYALPIAYPGDFAFRVATRDGQPLGTWNFLGDDASAGLQQLPPGPGYAFGLRLREGRDVMQRAEALVTGRFRTADGSREIGTNGAAEVLLGNAQFVPRTGENNGR